MVDKKTYRNTPDTN